MGQIFPYQFAPLRPLGFVSVAITSGAVIELAPPVGTKGALVQAIGGNINWTDDGTDPTNAVGGGMSLTAGAEPSWFGAAALSPMKLIAVGSATHLLVSYYG